MYYWIDFNNRTSGTVEAKSETAALERAKEFGAPTRAQVLPYPANPRLAVESECPSFCFQPRQCVGHTACPSRRSCTE